MHKSLYKMFSAVTILAMMLMALPMGSARAAISLLANPTTTVFINEIHYDNASTDAGEAIEVAGPAGTDLTGWSIVLYNGSGGAAYLTINLSGVIANQQGGYGTLSFPAVGLQNGSPDGLALANGTTLVQFLSYEGTFAGVGGVANGVTSTDIGVSQAGAEPSGSSLQLTGTGSSYGAFTWTATTSHTFGNPNTGQNFGTTDVAPNVASTSPSDGATGVAVSTNITVNFSENVDVAAGAVTLECPAGTVVASNTATDNMPNVILDPANDLPFNTTCVINVSAGGVTDEDTVDPPDAMAENFSASFTTSAPMPQPGDVVISEVYGGGGNAGATYTNDFIELYNRTASSINLTGWSVQYGSATGTSWAATPLTGFIDPGGYYLVQEAAGANVAAPLPTPDATGTIAMGATAGKVALVQNSTPLSGACPTGSHISDFVGYGSTANCFEGTGPTANLSNTTSAQRLGNGATDTNNNSADFATAAPAPQSGADTAPTVTSTTPASGAANIGVGSNIEVTFSEAVNATNSSFTVSCSTSGIHTVAVSGGTTTFTVNPETDFVAAETCTVTVVGTQVSDLDTDDPPDTLAADYVFSFSTEGPVCEQTYTPIYTIQGSGTTAAVTGNVTTQGVVVGDFETTSGIQGFFIQDPTGDSNTATSDGILVFTGAADTVSVGDVVRVTGFARERFGQTAIQGANDNAAAVPAGNIVNCGNSSVALTDVTLPFSSTTDPERYEGMLVRFPQSLVIAEYFNYDQFGEIVLALPLAGESRPFTGTAIEEPGAPAIARNLANSLSRITLDDGRDGSNPTVLRHPNGDPFSLTNRFRGGDLVQNAVGVLGYGFNLYRIYPTAPANYTSVNPRPAQPEEVGGRLTVAAMNTLNFFLTLDTTSSDSGGGPCGGNANLDCRGADSSQPEEFQRQRTKLLAALAGLNTDIIGLNELENTPNVDPLGDPTNGIVAGLNSILGPGTYNYINTGVIGTDAIRVGLIYKPAEVTPVGSFEVLTSADDPRFDETRSRPSLAQTFEEVGTGARFTVVVNHFKSKGSACTGDPDLGDGQGNCNVTRTNAARALVDWLATDPTNSDDPDFMIVGDLNSYAQEDPIAAIRAGADDVLGTSDDYVNLIAEYQGPYAYSYTFDGQAGYLDHALAITSLAEQVTGAADWHINSDEPDVVDYDTSFKPPSQEELYEPNPYRSSDHDPVIVGLDLLAAPIANADNYTTDEDITLNIAAPGVLGNDTDANNDTLTAVLVSTTTNGTLTLNSDGSFSYTPAANFNGTDSFTYKANDGSADSNVAMVSITVNAVNDAPVAVNDTLTVAKNGSGTVSALANDYDVDGDTLSVTTFTEGAHGTVKYSARNNNFRYTPARGFTGTDTFTYTISDGNGGTATATVTVTVR